MKNINRNITAESLYYAFVLLTATDKDVYCYAYKKALFDNAGNSSWYDIYIKPKKKSKRSLSK